MSKFFWGGQQKIVGSKKFRIKNIMGQKDFLDQKTFLCQIIICVKKNWKKKFGANTSIVRPFLTERFRDFVRIKSVNLETSTLEEYRKQWQDHFNKELKTRIVIRKISKRTSIFCHSCWNKS